MHIRNKELFPLLDQIEPKISSSEVFLTEVEIDQLNFLEPGKFNCPYSLDEVMSASKYHKLGKQYRRMTGRNLESVKNLYPIFIQNLLSETVFRRNALSSMDEVLWEIAKRNGIRTGGIETIAEQLEVLEGIPYHYQLKSVISIIENQKSNRKKMKQLAKLYTHGRIQHLSREVRKGLGKMRKLLLYDRNVIMAQRIASLAGEYSLFCA